MAFDFEDMKKVAVKQLKEHKKHAPQFIFNCKEGLRVITALFDDYEEKNNVMNQLREFVRENKPVEYFFACESILSMYNTTNSKLVKKQDILVISWFHSDMRTKTEILPFKIVHDIIKMEKPLDMGDLGEQSSAWNFYVEKEGHEERMDKIKDLWEKKDER